MLNCRRYSGAYGSGQRAPGTELMHGIADFRFQDVTRREGDMKTWENSRVSLSSLNIVAQCGVGMLFQNFGFRFEDMTRKEGEMVKKGNSRLSPSSLITVTLAGSGDCLNEEYCDAEKVSGIDPFFKIQNGETVSKVNHFQVSDSEQRSTSILNFELFLLQDAWKNQ